MLDEYINIINEKIENNNIPATGIYFLLKTKYNFKGKYGIVRKYVSSKKQKIISDLTIRFETIQGYQSQVDWKEKLKLHDRFKFFNSFKFKHKKMSSFLEREHYLYIW